MSIINKKFVFLYNLSPSIEQQWILHSFDKILKKEDIKTLVDDDSIEFKRKISDSSYSPDHWIHAWKAFRTGSIRISQKEIGFQIVWKVFIGNLAWLSITFGIISALVLYFLDIKTVWALLTGLFSMIIITSVGLFRIKQRITDINRRSIDAI